MEKEKPEKCHQIPCRTLQRTQTLCLRLPEECLATTGPLAAGKQHNQRSCIREAQIMIEFCVPEAEVCWGEAPEKPAVFAGLQASGISTHHSPSSSSLLGSAMKLSFCTYVLVPGLHLFCIIIRNTHLCSATQNVVVQSSGNPTAALGFHGSRTKHLGPLRHKAKHSWEPFQRLWFSQDKQSTFPASL